MRGGYSKFEKNMFRLFSEAADKYMREKRGISDYKGICAAMQNVAPYINHLPIIDVDNDALETFKADRLKTVRAGTVNKDLLYVSAVLNRAARLWRWIPQAPLILHVDGPKAVPWVLSRNEQDELFKRLPGYIERAALFAVNTGVRQSELFGLDWRNEVRHENVMGFILRKTKNGQQRFCVCNSIARSVIESQRGIHSTRVFPSDDKKSARRNTVNYYWHMAWVASGLPDEKLILKGMHNLRHTFGHRLRASGVSESDVGTLLGHHNANITSHYSQPDIERLTELSERVVERRETVILRAVNQSHELCDDSAVA